MTTAQESTWRSVDTIVVVKLKSTHIICHIKAKLRQTLPFGEKFIADDPSEWLKENVEQFIAKALENPEEINLLQLMLNATENLSNRVRKLSK